jgi:hypothetical protein
MTSGTSDGAMKELHESNGRHTTTLRVPAQWKARKYDDDQDAHAHPQPAAHPQIHRRPPAAPGLAAAGFAAGAVGAQLPGCVV